MTHRILGRIEILGIGQKAYLSAGIALADRIDHLQFRDLLTIGKAYPVQLAVTFNLYVE